MRARRLLSLAGVFLFVAVALPLRSVAAEAGAAAFMTNVGNQVLQLLNDKQTPAIDREQKFEKLVTQNFDVSRIARFVLGPRWRTATAAERQQFAQVFQTYMEQSYWSLFSQYDGQSFAVTGQQAQSPQLTLVNMQIVQLAGKPTISVDWVVAKQADGFKISDVSIGGISQVLTYRDQFASFLDRNNGQVGSLIAELSKKTKG